MMIFKKTIPRRTFLRGAGATLALPLLDAMMPALTPDAYGAAGPDKRNGATPVRFAVVFVPNGRIASAWGPKEVGTNFTLPTTLAPLSAHQKNMLVISDLNSFIYEKQVVSGEAGPHATASGCFLTGVYPKPPGQAGISIDQIAAKEIGQQTQFASLELSLESGETGAGGDGADSEAYLNTMSWRSATTPLPTENNPRKLFERMFGEAESTDTALRKQQWAVDRSVLDVVTGQIAGLNNKLGTGDRAKLGEYLEAVRDVERRIRLAEEKTSPNLPVLARPAGMPENYADHARLMFDLLTLAFQTDMTRVSTFAMAREKSERAYRELGLEEGHHALTHHGYDKAMMAKCVQIEEYQSKQFAYFLDKLKGVQEAGRTLLDNSVILFASSISDGHSHSRKNLPAVLLGSGGGRIKGGRHIQAAKDTPVANLYLTMLDTVGVKLDHFGDSSGKLNLLPVA